MTAPREPQAAVTGTCEKCGWPTELHDALRDAKQKLGMPLTAPKRCDKCLCGALGVLNSFDEEEPAFECPQCGAPVSEQAYCEQCHNENMESNYG